MRLEPKDVQALYGGLLKDGLSPRSVHYTHTVLNSALKHAVGQRMIPSNPCQHVQLPRREATEMNAMNEQETRGFLKAAESNRMYAYFALLLVTGLRPAEGLALKWQDFDASTKMLRIMRHSSMSRVKRTLRNRR